MFQHKMFFVFLEKKNPSFAFYACYQLMFYWPHTVNDILLVHDLSLYSKILCIHDTVLGVLWISFPSKIISSNSCSYFSTRCFITFLQKKKIIFSHSMHVLIISERFTASSSSFFHQILSRMSKNDL